jgi:coenzyme PQQ precursor peptide PqqA
MAAALPSSRSRDHTDSRVDVGFPDASAAAAGHCATLKETYMAWQKPQATDLRYGFEITMYISAR